MDRPEPWLRGSLTDVPAVQRAVLHALEMAEEDLNRWCASLDQEQLHSRPRQVASVAFHIRHIAGSIDRLLTYAEGKSLSAEQYAALRSESSTDCAKEAIFAELGAALESARLRIRAFSAGNLEAARTVGRKAMPTTVGGLLVHIAEHTSRHVGQAITTAKIVMGKQTPTELAG
jgi:uncharacterized damage-inducible protein DinB